MEDSKKAYVSQDQIAQLSKDELQRLAYYSIAYIDTLHDKLVQQRMAIGDQIVDIEDTRRLIEEALLNAEDPSTALDNLKLQLRVTNMGMHKRIPSELYLELAERAEESLKENT